MSDSFIFGGLNIAVFLILISAAKAPSTASLITVTKRHDRITPALAPQPRLPVRVQIDFKILLPPFRALNCPATEYISDLLTCYVHSNALRPVEHCCFVFFFSQVRDKKKVFFINF